ncbi:MAG: flagellar hook-associated protein FlgL [Bacteriovoracaceae bacterium]|jgi:flagellar hook-associated protein 3 FlgL|nr:flagellar hook-associated protein FlgL [Bacteriovoracaceae bacterium]
MSRVSEMSAKHAINFSMSKAKSKLEDLQIKGTNLKRMTKPSDDPIGNIDLLAIRSRMVDSEQFSRNATFASAQLNITEQALSEVSDILMKTKELAISQSSDFYNSNIRKSVANEVKQLRAQVLAISNRRLGSRYLFSGQKTLTPAFKNSGKYQGDEDQIFIEVGKDFFIPINLNGIEVFFEKPNTSLPQRNPLEGLPQTKDEIDLARTENLDPTQDIKRAPAVQSVNKGAAVARSIFDILDGLETALKSNNPDVIQDLLPEIDSATDRVISFRTRVGSLINSIERSEVATEEGNVRNAELKSQVEDADVAELFSDIARQQAVLKATYRTGSELINKTLLDFLR